MNDNFPSFSSRRSDLVGEEGAGNSSRSRASAGRVRSPPLPPGRVSVAAASSVSASGDPVLIREAQDLIEQSTAASRAADERTAQMLALAARLKEAARESSRASAKEKEARNALVRAVGPQAASNDSVPPLPPLQVTGRMSGRGSRSSPRASLFEPPADPISPILSPRRGSRIRQSPNLAPAESASDLLSPRSGPSVAQLTARLAAQEKRVAQLETENKRLTEQLERRTAGSVAGTPARSGSPPIQPSSPGLNASALNASTSSAAASGSAAMAHLRRSNRFSMSPAGGLRTPDAAGPGDDGQRPTDCPFICMTCGNAYSTVTLLDRHRELRHGDGSGGAYKCAQCGNCYTEPGLLARHQMLRGHQQQHGADSVTESPAQRRMTVAERARVYDQKFSNAADTVAPAVPALLSPRVRSRLTGAFKDPAAHAALIRIQSRWRGVCARKLLTMIKRRIDILNEMLTTEVSYVEGLRTVLKEYVEPMTNRVGTASEIVSKSSIETIFCNLKDILAVNESLLVKMKIFLKLKPDAVKLISMQAWLCCLSPVFSGPQLDQFRVYAQYVNNFLLARQCLDQQRLSNPRFSQFISRPTRKMLDINDILITPIQRVPRYKMLLLDLLKNTAPDHADFTGLQEAVDNVEALAMFMNEDNRRYSELVKTASKVTGFPGLLTAPDRLFWLRDALLDDKGKERVGLLFNDLLLECKNMDPNPDPGPVLSPRAGIAQPPPTSTAVVSEQAAPSLSRPSFLKRTKREENGLKVKRFLKLTPEARVASLPDQKTLKHVFQVSCGGITLVFSARSAEEKDRWTDCLRKACGSRD